ncbi:MAG: hypothetical protein KDA78_19625 [Planctomycetaceae bacterium]|nr:hypothetical protein [Planctomycetaceae bacterium]
MSVYFAHGEAGAFLDDLIGAADAMNHAIPTVEELSRSLTRLATCGILSETNNRFRIAEEYLPKIGVARKARGGLFSTPDKGKKWLTRMTFHKNKPVEVTITTKRFDEAYKKYSERVRKHT